MIKIKLTEANLKTFNIKTNEDLKAPTPNALQSQNTTK